MKLHTIWTSEVDFKDWEDDLREQYPEKPEDRLRDIMYERNNDYLGDEQINCDQKLPRPVVFFGDLGHWDGRSFGLSRREIWNLKDCIEIQGRDTLDATFYIDENGDLVAEEKHHDATNYLIYRMYKEGVTEDQKEELAELAYEGKLTKKDMEKYTERIGDFVAKVYGWTDLPAVGSKALPEEETER